jgi:sugar phosphate isomerase/epimerase
LSNLAARTAIHLVDFLEYSLNVLLKKRENMQESIQEYCKIGIVSFMLWKDTMKGEGDYNNIQKIIDDPFFDAIEMTWIKDAEIRKRISEQIEQSGKTVGFGAQPVLLGNKLDMNHLNENERQKAVESLIHVIPHAYDLKAEGFAVLSGKTVPKDKRQQALDQLVKSLKEVAAALKEKGNIPLILETFDSVPYGKNALVGPSEDAVRIAQQMRTDYPDFGLMLDLSHLPLLKETPEHAVSTVKNYLIHAHMGNCIMEKPHHPMNGDEHPPFEDPDGENGIDELAAYLKELLKAGYLNKKTRPVLSFEVCVYNDWDQTGLIKQSKDILNQAWAKV